MDFRLGELFCGPGGIGIAAKRLVVSSGSESFRISHAWANDIDPDTCETYRNNIVPESPDHVICDDVRSPALLDRLAEISGIDALAFGFPCNDFSIVGESLGINGSYGPLYSYGVKALERFQPKWFLAENVGGLSSSNDGDAFKYILRDMQGAGYRLYPHLYSFDLYGVPQRRRRIIIVGIRKDLDVTFQVPSPQPYSHLDVSAQKALEDPPIKTDAANNQLTNQHPRVVERLNFIKPGQNAFNSDLPDHLRLNVKGAKISQIYRRLKADKPSYTVTGSGGGGTHVYHWSEPRALTNRERARLQSFPDDFVFEGGKGSVRKQIGMAVPPDGIQVILEAVLKSFAGIDYPSIPSSIDVEKMDLNLIPE